MQPNVTTTRNVTVSNTSPIAVSDQVRGDSYTPPTRPEHANDNAQAAASAAPGNPYHGVGWGARGTDGSPMPRAATVAQTPPQASAQQPTAPVEPQPPVEPELPSPNAAPTPTNDDANRVATLEKQVAELGELLKTATAQLQGTVSPTPLPGTANPSAPKPHYGSTVQGAVLRHEGPVIPKPDTTAIDQGALAKIPRLPNQAPIPQLLPGEEELAQAQYIEKHFRHRDMSIEQIAYMCHMDPIDVIAVLKELGYHFSDGV